MTHSEDTHTHSQNATEVISRQQRHMELIEALRQNWYQVAAQVLFWHQTCEPPYQQYFWFLKMFRS